MKNISKICIIFIYLFINYFTLSNMNIFAGQSEEKTEIARTEKKQEFLVKVTKKDKMDTPFYRTGFSTTGIKFKYFNFGHFPKIEIEIERIII